MALGFDGTIRIDSRIETRNFNAGVKHMGAALKPLAAAIAAAFAARAVVAFGKSAVSAASELASAMTGLKSVLDGTGKSFAEGRKFIDDYIADGLVPATNAINAYKNLALRGYDTSQIEKTLIALKDSAAFGRQSSLTLGEAVQSATEGLKNENSILVDNAGVTKNVAKMWDSYARSIGTTAGNLTKQQKIQAEVNGILEETRFQAGDAARLTKGYAGLVASLSTSLYNLKVALGKAIIPVLSAIIPLIKQVIDGLVVVVNQFALFVSALFGVKLGVDAVADSTKNAADATGALADAQGEAEKAATGALAAFDQLNVLQQPDKPAAAAPVITPPAVDPAPVESGLSAIEQKVAAFKEKLLALLGPASESFERLKGAVEPLGQIIRAGLGWAWENVLKPLGKWAVESLLPATIDLLAGAFTVLNSVLEALKPLGLWLWEEFLKPAGAWLGDKIIEALGWLTDKLYDLSDWIKTHQETVQTIAIVLGAFALAWVAVSVAIGVFNIVAGIAAGIIAILTSPITLVVIVIGLLIAAIILLIKHWDEVKVIAGKVWDWIVEKWGDAKDWFSEKVLTPLAAWFKNAWEDIKKFPASAWEWIKQAWKDAKDWFGSTVLTPLKNWFEQAWKDIRGFPQAAWQKIKEVWQGVKDWFQTNVITPVTDWFKGAWDSIKLAAEDAWTLIQRAWQGAANWFETNVIDPIKNAWNTISNAVSSVWNGVKSTIYGVINSIISFMNNMIYKLINGLNDVIGKYNSVAGWTGLYIQPILAPLPIGPIPYLATGAVIPPNAEFLAMLGDQRSGRNIEAPEGLLRQIVREEIGRIETDVRIEFAGSLGALVRELQPRLAKETTRIGGSLVKGSAR